MGGEVDAFKLEVEAGPGAEVVLDEGRLDGVAEEVAAVPELACVDEPLDGSPVAGREPEGDDLFRVFGHRITLVI